MVRFGVIRFLALRVEYTSSRVGIIKYMLSIAKKFRIRVDFDHTPITESQPFMTVLRVELFSISSYL